MLGERITPHAEHSPFDMVGCDLTHHGEDVTFETIPPI